MVPNTTNITSAPTHNTQEIFSTPPPLHNAGTLTNTMTFHPKSLKPVHICHQMVPNITLKNSGLSPHGAERHKSSGASPVDACCSPMQVIVSHQLPLSLLPAAISPFSPLVK